MFSVLEIGYKVTHAVYVPQDCGGMIRHQKAIMQDLTAKARYAVHSQDGSCGHIPHQAYNVGLKNINLSHEVGKAGFDLSGFWFSVFRRPAFYDAGNENIGPRQARLSQGPVQQPSRSPHKGPSRQILLPTGGLADQHYPCRIGAFSRNGTVAAFRQIAETTDADLFVQGQKVPFRQAIWQVYDSCRFFFSHDESSICPTNICPAFHFQKIFAWHSISRKRKILIA
jgi:hypothetical protein